MIAFQAILIDFAVATNDTAPYPEWAHHHLVWKSHGHPQAVIMAMLENYSHHHIGVGAVNVDSGWSTGYNNFIFDTKLFPDPKGLIDFVHNRSQRIVLWTTSMVNVDSSNYAQAVANNYVFNVTQNWWHGDGRLLNFRDDAAKRWWEQQIQTNLFDKYGCIDGWKCDGTDPWILELIVFHGLKNWTWPEYSNDYYGFFFNFTRRQCGDQSLIMSRPSDCVPAGGIDHTGICPLHLPFAPRSVAFMGWVGDQDSTFKGLGVAYGNMMASATAGFVSFGSDTGGYRGNGPDAVAKDLFLRWAALNAMMPVFENGGDRRHCPWEFDEETVAIYREFVDFHHGLVPYLYSHGTKLAAQPNGSLVTPVALGGHLLGPSFFAYPILEPNVSVASFFFPESPSGGWYRYNTTDTYSAGQLATFNCSALSTMLFFVDAETVVVHYDTEGRNDVLFPSNDFPLVVRVYTAVDRRRQRASRTYQTSGADYMGLAIVEVSVNETSEAIDPFVSAPVIRWRRGARRRAVKVCVVSPGRHSCVMAAKP